MTVGQRCQHLKSRSPHKRGNEEDSHGRRSRTGTQICIDIVTSHFYYPVQIELTSSDEQVRINKGVLMTSSNRRQAVPTGKTAWHSRTMRLTLVFAILFLIAFVALAAPQDRDHDRDRDPDRDHDRNPIRVSEERVSQ